MHTSAVTACRGAIDDARPYFHAEWKVSPLGLSMRS
jgi:hypothetical protein